MFHIIKAVFLRDFRFQISYKLSYFTELFFAFLLIFFLFFLSNSFNFAEESMYSKFKGDFFLYSITGFSIVNVMGQCYGTVINNLRESQSFGYIEEMYITDNKFIFLCIAPVFYAFVKSFIRLIIIFGISWYLAGSILNTFDLILLLILCFITLVAFIGISLLGVSIILVFKKGDYLSLIFIGGSLLISGAIYPNEVLPEILIKISEILPLTHTLELTRDLLILENSSNFNHTSMLKLIFLSSLYLVCGYTVAKKSLKYSRKKGIFSDY